MNYVRLVVQYVAHICTFQSYLNIYSYFQLVSSVVDEIYKARSTICPYYYRISNTLT